MTGNLSSRDPVLVIFDRDFRIVREITVKPLKNKDIRRLPLFEDAPELRVVIEKLVNDDTEFHALFVGSPENPVVTWGFGWNDRYCLLIADRILSLAEILQVMTRTETKDAGTRQSPMQMGRYVASQERIWQEMSRLNNELANAQRELYRKHAALERLYQHLEQVNRELDAFNYRVSHDLKNPLFSIAGLQNVLEELHLELPEDGQYCVEHIGRIARSLMEQIDGLLSLSRETSGYLSFRHVDLSQIFTELSEQMQQREPEREVRFRIEEGILAEADPRLMRTLLQNLIENAWKYSRDASPTIIEFGRSAEGSQVEYFVRDNGRGFKPEEANRLFEVFYRTDLKSDIAGMGIGLATVQRIIHRHFGSVRAEGKENEGATFYFTLNTRDAICPVGDRNGNATEDSDRR